MKHNYLCQPQNFYIFGPSPGRVWSLHCQPQNLLQMYKSFLVLFFKKEPFHLIFRANRFANTNPTSPAAGPAGSISSQPTY